MISQFSIQRFGSALNLNIHFHMLFLDGVYTGGSSDPIWFRRTKAPTRAELTRLTHTIALRVGRYLERQGLIERDSGNIFLTREALGVSDEDPTNQLLGSSITYRIAVGSQQGQKVFTLQTLPDCGNEPFTTRVANVAGVTVTIASFGLYLLGMTGWIVVSAILVFSVGEMMASPRSKEYAASKGIWRH